MANQPQLNLTQPAIYNKLIKVMKFWLLRGVDGLSFKVSEIQLKKISMSEVIEFLFSDIRKITFFHSLKKPIVIVSYSNLNHQILANVDDFQNGSQVLIDNDVMKKLRESFSAIDFKDTFDMWEKAKLTRLVGIDLNRRQNGAIDFEYKIFALTSIIFSVPIVFLNVFYYIISNIS